MAFDPHAGNDHTGYVAEQLVALRLACHRQLGGTRRTIHGYGCGPITEPRQ
jgi:hypothetical protein